MLKLIAIILKKELLELIRDKFTIMVLILPLIVFPIFNISMNSIDTSKNDKIKIAVISNNPIGNELFNMFKKNTKMQITQVDTATEKNLNNLLNNGSLDCYIFIENQNITITYNSISYNSLMLATKLGEDFSHFYSSVYSQIDKNFFTMNLCDEQGNILNTKSSLTNLFTPVIIILFITQGVLGFSNDLFAGERERKTLELLLLSNTKRNTIYYGKSLALFILSLINCAFCFISFWTSSFLFDEEFKFMQSETLKFNLLAIVITLFLLSIITVFLSTTISMISTNIRNSQMLNELIFSIPTLLILMKSFGIISKDFVVLKYTPILNIINVFSDAFSNIALPSDLMICVITNIIFIILLVYFSLKYLKTEKFISRI